MIASGRIASVLLALATLTTGLAAIAQTYPSRPVTIVVPYAAGGATDVATRLVADRMAPILGGQIIVENKPGVATIVGTEYVARAPKDGYTLLMAAASTFSTNPHLYRKLTYKLEDFDAVSLITKLPYVLNVAQRVPATNAREFVAWAKSRPDGVTYGTVGAGSSTHVTGMLLASALGIKMVDVPYKGDAPARADLIAGTLDAQIDSLVGPVPLHKEGKTRIIGVLDDTRWHAIPDVPTFGEQGFPGAEGYSWFAIMAPTGTPAPILAKLADAAAKVMAMEDVKQRFLAGGQMPMPMPPEATARFIRADNDRWGRIIRASGLQLD
jgi:tripartite-type tricarboxylate transporter receptor subunit TctC